MWLLSVSVGKAGDKSWVTYRMCYVTVSTFWKQALRKPQPQLADKTKGILQSRCQPTTSVGPEVHDSLKLNDIVTCQ